MKTWAVALLAVSLLPSASSEWDDDVADKPPQSSSLTGTIDVRYCMS